MYRGAQLGAYASYSDRSLDEESLDRPTRVTYIDPWANIWFDLGDARRALVLFDQAVMWRDVARKQLARAMCCSGLGQQEEAVAALRRAVRPTH